MHFAKGALNCGTPLPSINVFWNEAHEKFGNKVIEQYLISEMAGDRDQFKQTDLKQAVQEFYPHLFLPAPEDQRDDGVEDLSGDEGL